MPNWTESHPSDGDPANSLGEAIRLLRTEIKGIVEQEHGFPSGEHGPDVVGETMGTFTLQHRCPQMIFDNLTGPFYTVPEDVVGSTPSTAVARVKVGEKVILRAIRSSKHDDDERTWRINTNTIGGLDANNYNYNVPLNEGLFYDTDIGYTLIDGVTQEGDAIFYLSFDYAPDDVLAPTDRAWAWIWIVKDD